MNFELLISNLTNPAFMFFILGIIAVKIKSDLEIPESSSKFISLYLLFAIGFKGGQELSHESITTEIFATMVLGICISVLIPIYTFFILKRKFTIYDSVAISAAYGSVSAVTFVTGATYLESQNLELNGHMVAVMAIMESPAIISALLMLSQYAKEESNDIDRKSLIIHSFTNGSVLLILGSLLIGYLANAQQAEGIRPFTTDIFKGFLAIFLLDMGLSSGKKLKSLTSGGIYPLLFAIIVPLVNGSLVAWISQIATTDVSNRFMIAVLAASASYIAVPAAMKLAVPKANPGLFLPMALAITFPLNITIGMPLYLSIIQ